MKPSLSTSSLDQIFSCFKPYQLSSSNLINDQLSKILTLLIRDHISSWFSLISPNDDFLMEIIKVIEHIFNQLEHRLSKLDWVVLLSQDLPQLLKIHIREIRSCSAKLGTAYAGGKSLEELFHGCQPHIALDSADSEREYLRRVADIFLNTFLPVHEFRCDTVRLLLRELLTNNILVILIENFSDPDFIMEVFLELLEPEEFDSLFGPEPVTHSIAKAIPVQKNPVSVPQSTPSSFTKRLSTALFELPYIVEEKRDRKKQLAQIGEELGKLTLGKLGKVTSGLGKLKNMALSKKREHALRTDLEFEGTPLISSQTSAISVSKEEDNSLLQANLPPVDNLEDIPVKQNSLETNGYYSVPDKEIEKHEQDPVVPSDRAWSNLRLVLSELRKLYSETKIGPWTLGPIDATKYHQINLDLQIAELIYELSDLQGSQKWLISQLTFFLEPVFHGMLGPMVNRLILKGTYFFISEETVAKYLLSFRLTFWPNNQIYQPPPPRTTSEKTAMRRILKSSIENVGRSIC